MTQQIPQEKTTNLQPLPPAPPLPFRMKGNLAEYRRRLGVLRFVIAFILLGIIYVRFGLIPWIITTSIVAAVILIMMYVLAKREVTLNSDGVIYKGAFGRTQRFRYDEINTVKVFLGYIEAGFGPAPRIIVGKNIKGVYFTMTTLYWKVEEIDQLLAVIKDKKVLIETYDTPADSSMIAKQFPQYVSAFERHPYWIATGIVLLILIAIIAFVLIVS